MLCDPASFLAAFFVFLGNALLIAYYEIEKNREDWDPDKYSELDPEYLKLDWSWRRENRQLEVAGKMITALSWVILTAPILQICVVLSKGGERMLWLHVSIACIALGAAITEIAAQLMHLGAFNAADWVSVEFQLEDWSEASSTVTTSPRDFLGWQALEVSYRQVTGITLWIDSVEYLALSVIFLMIFASVNTMGGYPQNIGLFLGGFAFFIGLLSFADFICYVLRFKFWTTASLVGRIIAVMNRVIFIPLWLMILSCKLPACTQAHKRENEDEEQNGHVIGDADAAFT